jgi:hypothetical protein
MVKRCCEMSDEEVLERLAKLGFTTGLHGDAWRRVADLLAALDAVARDGGHALVKVDGGRTGEEVYTVLVAGGRLGEEFFRKDGADLRALLREALSFVVAHCADQGLAERAERQER